ncbi:cell growth-regulating nucleolar protein [Cryptosporidium ryanae]|uniref:cell growth-regulating nucleolar protein n=1 Tax=Cryptosporidium ryanae TaxID=515981 RepID=UPI003519DBCF|nr:cell growth-regulating nucleolar protein [Cryptosporidium ryanae]
MVSFVCGSCQEVLKKNKVDSHCVRNCLDAWEFTCIDCNVTFEGFKYKSHSKCITEEEKYHVKFSKMNKNNLNMKSNNEGNYSRNFIDIINEILEIKGSMSWKSLRDKSVNEYCRRSNIKINSCKFKKKLGWECLASIPINYTCKDSNIIRLHNSF